jgi:very-short-patch-repair endonuclease
MCTVATFGSGDLDITKTSKGGAAFLREYLAFVESEGKKLPDKGSTRIEMNPFEQSVYDQLTRRGIMLLPQYGVGNYRLDFAVQNPNKPGAFVMAIECDGRSYHSFPTARERDRLREAALRARGWDFHRIWSDHWFANPEIEVERALAVINAALTTAQVAPVDLGTRL